MSGCFAIGGWSVALSVVMRPTSWMRRHIYRVTIFLLVQLPLTRRIVSRQGSDVPLAVPSRVAYPGAPDSGR